MIHLKDSEIYNIIIATDQEAFIEGLKSVFENEKDMEIIGCAKSGPEAFELCKKKQPELVIMDLKMPVYDVIEAIKNIKAEFKDIKVVICTLFSDIDNISKTLYSKADGYINKDIATGELVCIIKKFIYGLRIEDPNAFDKNVPDSYDFETVLEYSNSEARFLDEREKRILKFLSLGKSHEEIASCGIFMSERIAKTVIEEVKWKLDLEVKTRGYLKERSLYQ